MAAARNSAGKRGSKRTSETPHGTWLSRSWKDSLWLCYAGSFTGRQKSGISGVGKDPKADSLEEEQLGKIGEKNNEEKKPATE